MELSSTQKNEKKAVDEEHSFVPAIISIFCKSWRRKKELSTRIKQESSSSWSLPSFPYPVLRERASSLRMVVPRVLLFLFSFTVLQPSLLQSAPTDFLSLLYQDCLRNSSSSLTASFSRNLNITLGNFSTMASQGSYYSTATTGVSGTDTLYAVFQCRGDLTVETCYVCVQNATALLPDACPKSVGARIQLDGCFLRYDNRSFFSLDTNVRLTLCNVKNNTDITALTAIQNAMGRVISLAPQQRGFAFVVQNAVYAEAQCIGYIDSSECSQCLTRYSYGSFCVSSIGKRLFTGSCFYRFELYNFFDRLPSPPPPPIPAPATPAATNPAAPPGGNPGAPPIMAPSPAVSPTKSNGSKLPIIIGIIVPGLGITIVAVAILVYCHKAKRFKGASSEKQAPDMPDIIPEFSLPDIIPDFGKVFSLQELEIATQGFHPNNKIGQGGFGVVYKGTLNGQEVAIKRIMIGNQARKEEFLNEVKLITSVQHKNLIRLLGCCVDESERILVYEYLPNQSLDGFLFGQAQKKKVMGWQTRYEIILGMAKGLAYLHEESHYRIIHRDIKASNILLDNQLRPVIADFGLARLLDASHINTRVAGTIGYLAPEYAMHGELSEKVDIFSFGVVCLEIITAMQNINGRLLKLVWEHYEGGNVADIVDKSLGNAFSIDKVVRVVHIALLCIQEDPKQRPPVSRITIWLSGTSDILEKPIKPTFLNYSAPASSSSGAEKSACSEGVLTESEIEPR
ncbi:hypothetical protein KP509_34G051600 [Ceratopteris richardii]|uniref:Uncharacterized protein n=1 Tax=Ceratopteris richardii TaxID=49495 RepID=A0A8T2QLJ8_CERRI|nr:hypothetical protein KP509_34G051600 [Ceratopteris richardii]